MSRSGYSDDWDDYNLMNLYRGSVDRAIGGKRGQNFLCELAAAMDAMPEKRLIDGDLITESGEMCTLGVICKVRGLDVSRVNVEDNTAVGKLVNIAQSMAAEIAYENDERMDNESPEQRWIRMRKWVGQNMKKTQNEPAN